MSKWNGIDLLIVSTHISVLRPWQKTSRNLHYQIVARVSEALLESSFCQLQNTNPWTSLCITTVPETTSADVHSEWNSIVSIVLQPTTRVVKSSCSAQGSGRRPSRSREDLLWKPLDCINHCMDLTLRVSMPGLRYTVSTLLLKSNSLCGYDPPLAFLCDPVLRLSSVWCCDFSDLFRLADLTNPSSRLSPVTLNLPK
jgi:hypothetical protein